MDTNEIVNRLKQDVKNLLMTNEIVQSIIVGWVALLPVAVLIYFWPILVLYLFMLAFVTLIALLVGYGIRTALTHLTRPSNGENL